MDYKVNGKSYELIDDTKIKHLKLLEKIENNPNDINSIIKLSRSLFKGEISEEDLDELGIREIGVIIEMISQEIDTTEIKKKQTV